MAYCYILRCADASYYVGSTHEIAARLAKHVDGSASRYTAARRPLELVFSEAFASMDQALARERQVKGWTRAKKEALIAADAGRLNSLSRSNSSKS